MVFFRSNHTSIFILFHFIFKRSHIHLTEETINKGTEKNFVHVDWNCPFVAKVSGAHNILPWVTSDFCLSCAGRFHVSPSLGYSWSPSPGPLYAVCIFPPLIPRGLWWSLCLPPSGQHTLGWSSANVERRWWLGGSLLLWSRTSGEAFCMLLRKTHAVEAPCLQRWPW